ncbi:cation:dicarboxylate symporter family transporter [Vibrio metschnikovii]
MLGSVFGLALQLIFNQGSPVIRDVLSWISIVGSGYVELLKMVIMPLVLVSMISAVVKLDNSGSLGKISLSHHLNFAVHNSDCRLIGILITHAFGI